MAFVPIKATEYVKKHIKINPRDNAAEFDKQLRRCIADALAGAVCHCGAPIWVIGSVSTGHACFTCITGEGWPEDDYEIDEVLAARGH
jgi:hypothetical protein